MGEGGEGGRGTREEARARSFAGRVEGRGGWEKEEEGEAHRRRAHRRRLGKTDLQRRRTHRFTEEEGTQFCIGGGHTIRGNGLTYFSYLLSVHANF